MKSTIVCLLLGVLLWTGGASQAAEGQSTPRSGTYFSQGQALFNPQDRVKSQQEALRDFQSQAVLQALGVYLSPSQMASAYNVIQDRVLSHPERYVQTYQVFSEVAGAGGLYRVTGQVTVALELLEADLAQLGIGRETATGSAARPPAEQPATEVGGTVREPTPHPAASSRDILWAVAEKWGDRWTLAQAKGGAEAPFATSVLQESGDYSWELRLPASGALSVGENGEIPREQVTALAQQMGLERAVVGTLHPGAQPQQKGTILEATLRLVDTTDGRVRGEIRRSYSVEDDDDQEAVMELAGLVVPQLDRLLRESEVSAPSRDTPVETPKEPPAQSASPPESGGEWTITIRSDHPFGHWSALEKVLREHFSAMQVHGLELGAKEDIVRVEGVDGYYVTTLQGTSLPGGIRLDVEQFSPEERTLTVRLSQQTSPPPGPAQ